jgi:Uma2 family endonuclease
MPRHRFSVDDYHRMAESGILKEDDRVELIEGEIVEMTPVGSRHAAVVKRLNRSLASLPRDRYLVGVQDPVRVHPYSEPQPDVTVLRARADDYEATHPGPEDVLLIIEVVDSSEAYDRGVKLRLYSRAGIPEVWLVVLSERTVEVFRRPGPSGYEESNAHRPGDEIAARSVPELLLPVSAVFPG